VARKGGVGLLQRALIDEVRTRTKAAASTPGLQQLSRSAKSVAKTAAEKAAVAEAQRQLQQSKVQLASSIVDTSWVAAVITFLAHPTLPGATDVLLRPFPPDVTQAHAQQGHDLLPSLLDTLLPALVFPTLNAHINPVDNQATTAPATVLDGSPNERTQGVIAALAASRLMPGIVDCGFSILPLSALTSLQEPLRWLPC
jgi:hypothetical protein